MRVLGLIGALPDATAPAGPPRALALLRILSDAGHDVELVVGEPLNDATQPLADAAASLIGGPVSAAPGGGPLATGTLSLRWALPVRLAAERSTPLARAARSRVGSVDLIMSFDDAGHGAASAVSDDVPTVMDLHHLGGMPEDGDWARTSRERWLIQPQRSWERRVLARGMAVMAPSRQAQHRIDRLYYRRPVIVPTPVPAVEPAPAIDGAFVVGWFGDTSDPDERAGLAALTTQIWPSVGTPGAELVLADAAQSTALAAAGAAPGVSLLRAASVAELAARCTIAVRPTHRAGGDGAFTLALMAAGLPVVGTPQAFEGIDMHDGMEGLVAETPIELAAALRKLAADPSSTRQIAGQGQQHVLRRHAADTILPLVEQAIAHAQARHEDLTTGRVPHPLDPAGVKREIEETLALARAAGTHER
ncbi:MAG: glycosyltransferase [Solirubrobacteraceae bacterium]|nr:glycosyltransferase [Solirubrobacteraceae bacterium]